jgi:hypothetical protein
LVWWMRKLKVRLLATPCSAQLTSALSFVYLAVHTPASTSTPPALSMNATLPSQTNTQIFAQHNPSRFVRGWTLDTIIATSGSPSLPCRDIPIDAGRC